MKRLFAWLCIATFAISAAPTAAADSASALAAPYAAFGFDLLRQVRREQPKANIFLSPTSIAVALAMTAEGSAGTTHAAILRTLHAGDVAQFSSLNRQLAREMRATKSVQLSIANAVWVQDGFAVKPPFRKTLAENYDAEAANLDFRSPEAAATVNAWAAKHTNDRIRKLLDRVDPATVVMLTNAIAFKGSWTDAFSTKVTAPHDFTTGSGAIVRVPMMSNTAHYRYSESGGIQAIRLPYADGSFAMYVVLPRDGETMDSLVKGLNPTVFDRLIADLSRREGTIQLPRFSIDFDATLNDALKALGMGVAFGERANFDGIHAPPPHLAITDVRHSSFLNVDEHGTEAEAATSVGIGLTAIRVEPTPFHMIVDRPFLLAIRDERNGQLLFLGTIESPAA